MSELAKRVTAATVAAHFGTPRRTAATLGRNPQLLAFGGGGAAAAGSGAPHLDRRRTQAQQSRRDTTARGVYGAVAGQSAYQGAVYASNSRANRKFDTMFKDPAHRRGYKDTAQKKTVEGLKRTHGAGSLGYWRSMPNEIPGGRHLRVNSHLAGGRSGVAIGAAVTGIGAAAGMRSHGRKQTVAKALYAREQRTVPLRQAELGLGGALAAYGLGNSRMLGRALASGIKDAKGKDNLAAMRALQMAQAAQGSLGRGTRVGERVVRQVAQVNHAVELVPRGLRPAVAATAGLLLAGHAIPTRRTVYRPISVPVGYVRSYR